MSRGQKHAGIGQICIDISILRNTGTFWKEINVVEFHVGKLVIWGENWVKEWLFMASDEFKIEG